MIFNYKEFINEGLRSKLKANPTETIKQRLSQMNILDWVKEVKDLKLDDSYLPSDEQINDKLSELDNNDKIITILFLGAVYYDLLPRIDGMCVYEGSISSMDFPNEIYNRLPDNLTINGDLICVGRGLNRLPLNLTVNGFLNCYNNDLETIPAGLHINGHFDCSKNKIKVLPANLTIKGDMHCGMNKLKKLPENLTVGRDLHCENQRGGLLKLKLKLPVTANIGGEFFN